MILNMDGISLHVFLCVSRRCCCTLIVQSYFTGTDTALWSATCTPIVSTETAISAASALYPFNKISVSSVVVIRIAPVFTCCIMAIRCVTPVQLMCDMILYSNYYHHPGGWITNMTPDKIAVDCYVLTWLLIGWQHSSQAIGSHIKKWSSNISDCSRRIGYSCQPQKLRLYPIQIAYQCTQIVMWPCSWCCIQVHKSPMQQYVIHTARPWYNWFLLQAIHELSLW